MAGGGVGEGAALASLIASMSAPAEAAALAAPAAATAAATAAPIAAATGGGALGVGGLGSAFTGIPMSMGAPDAMMSMAAPEIGMSLGEPAAAAAGTPDYLKALLYAQMAMNQGQQPQGGGGMVGHGPMSSGQMPQIQQPPSPLEMMMAMRSKRKLSELLGGGMV